MPVKVITGSDVGQTPALWNTLAVVHTVGARLHINQPWSRPGALANQIARIVIAFRFRPIRSGLHEQPRSYWLDFFS